MNSALGDNEAASSHAAPWLLAPMDGLSLRGRGWIVGLASALVLAWCVFLNGDLHVAWGLPDVKFYLDMAYGRYDQVPEPFSSRPLAPLLARLIALLGHLALETGFAVVAYLSVAWTLLVVFWLLSRSRAPRWVLLAVATVPFWPQLLGFAGLPDPLYTALLATVLLFLEYGWTYLAAATLFPLMVARESTVLVLVCLLLIAWRRLRWGGAALAVGSVVAGAAVVHPFRVSGLPNPEHVSGAVYMLGKMVSNTSRSLGVSPWSNVYPELCEVPAWQVRIHVDAVRSVGVCSWTHTGPAQLTWALCTTFGILPVLLLWLWRRWKSARLQGGLLVPFCLLYGGVSLLLAPTLGTWYARLVGYGWPALLVAVPRLAESRTHGEGRASMPMAQVAAASALLVVHLLVSFVGNEVGTLRLLLLAVVLQGLAFALLVGQRQTLGQA